MSHPTHGHDDGHEHVTPLPVYFAIFGALMFLTVVTVGVSYMGLGAASIYVAMFVAIIKAALVAGYFMHLKWDDPFNRLIFVSSILFMAIFFVITSTDLGYRGEINPENGTFVLREEEKATATEAARRKAFEAHEITLQHAPGAIPTGAEVVTPVRAPDAAAPAAAAPAAAPAAEAPAAPAPAPAAP